MVYTVSADAIHGFRLMLDTPAHERIVIIATSGRVDLTAIRMNVERPFLFVVRDHENGIPLLVARITDIG
jgi:serine protease inhibitor